MSNRTSYVIAPDGKIVFVHSDLDWKDHVAKTLAAVRALRAGALTRISMAAALRRG